MALLWLSLSLLYTERVWKTIKRISDLLFVRIYSSHFFVLASVYTFIISYHQIAESIARLQRSLWQSRTEIPIGDSLIFPQLCNNNNSRHYTPCRCTVFFLFLFVLYFRHDTESRGGVNQRQKKMDEFIFIFFSISHMLVVHYTRSHSHSGPTV